MVYAIPQEEFYFDVLYNGKENVQLNFDSEKEVSFTSSKEHRIFDAYFKEINAAKQAFIDFYQSGKADKDTFAKLTDRLRTAQKGYEDDIEKIASELKGRDAAYRFHIYHSLYTKAAAKEFYATAIIFWTPI